MQVLFRMSVPTVGLFLLVVIASAADKPVKAGKQWMGSVADAKREKDAPNLITNAKDFEKMWKSWKVGDKVPDIDFTKEIVVVATTVGSKLNLTCSLDDKGDLKTLSLG